MKKALVLFSNGLDSRIVAKYIQNLNFKVTLLYVQLPFESRKSSTLEETHKFAKENNYDLKIVDVTKGKLFQNYLKIIKKPNHGRGKALNPCKDCKIFIFKIAKDISKQIHADIICSGEVLGQRPMSQMKKALIFDDKKAQMQGKILRPLSAKSLPETIYEKKGLIEREKLFNFYGKKRENQMKLAKKYKIKYPTPGGGCLLCEKDYSRKLKFLLTYDKKIKFEEINLLKLGRMFKKEGLIFVGRNEKENLEMEKLSKKLKWSVLKDKKIPGPYVIFEKKKDFEFVKELREAYRKKDLKERKKFEKFKV